MCANKITFKLSDIFSKKQASAETKTSSESKTKTKKTPNQEKTDENSKVSFEPKSSDKAGDLSFINSIVETLKETVSAIASQAKYSNFNASFDDMLGYVFDFEGGFSNIPSDKGGKTNYGITQTTYDEWNKRNGNSKKDVKNITKEEAKQIYYDDFYIASGAEEYVKKGNTAYAFILFDSAVNHGLGNAKKFDNQAKGNVDKIMETRKQYYKDIVENNKNQQKFALGWQNRWNKVYSIVDANHEYENYIA